MDTSSFREGSPIFNENWLDTQIQNGNQLTVATTNINSVSKGSFKEIMEEIKFDFNYEANLGIQIFTANISNGFSGGINYENYVSQYYYNLKSESVRYTYSLPNYSSNLDNYMF